MEKDTTLANRSINKKLILKVKECLVNHCNKKFGKVKLSDKFIENVCKVGFEINDQSENTPLITKTISTITVDKENVEPFFLKIPNNFLFFLKKLNLPFNFSAIFKEFVNRPLILRTIVDEIHNSSMRNIITTFIEKIQGFILGKEKLSNTDEQNNINFFRSFENNKINLQFKKMLEHYYLYINKIGINFFNQNFEINTTNIYHMNIYQKVYIWLFLIEDFFYCFKTRTGINRLREKLLKLIRIFKINNSSYQNLLSTRKKLKTNLDYELMDKELKEFVGRLLMFILLEPFSLKRLNPNQFSGNFLSVLKLEENQKDFLNCLGIFTVLCPHPVLELNKQPKIPSSLGMNPNSKSVKVCLRAINPVALIKMKNQMDSYQNYSWFCLSIYEAVNSINQSLNSYYLNRFKGASYKIRLSFNGIMFKYENDICSASRMDFNLNLEFINNTYKISDNNLEFDYQATKSSDNSNVCEEFIHRLSYLLDAQYKKVKINKQNSEVEFQSPTTNKDTIEKPKEESLQLIDQWDSTWKMNSESAAIVYILNKMDITIYNIDFPFTSQETFFPLYSVNNENNIDQKLASVVLAHNLSKMQNSCLNLYTISALNTIFLLDFNNFNFRDKVNEYKTKLIKATQNVIFNEISQVGFEINDQSENTPFVTSPALDQ